MRAPLAKPFAPTVRPLAIGLPLLSFFAGDATAQAGSENFVEWLNGTVQQIVTTRLEQTSSSNQVEAPSALGSSTSLVDHASLSDLVGFALTPPTFPRSGAGDAEATGQSFTLSPYAILAALTGRDPNDPYFYQENSAWRLLGITLGMEDAVLDNLAGSSDRVLVAGLKLKVWDERDVDPGGTELTELREMLLPEAGAAFARITTAVQDALMVMSGTDRNDDAAMLSFFEELESAASFRALLDGLSDDERGRLLAAVESEIEPFLALDRGSAALVERMRGAPQLSLAFTGRVSQVGRDTYRLGVAFDRDLAPGVAWTLNGGLEVREGMGSRTEDYGGTFATQLSLALGRESLSGTRGARLTLAARGSLLQDLPDQASLQAKLVLPITAGLEFPISLTWANRTDLIDEDDVFGQIGITMDTASLLRALQN